MQATFVTFTAFTFSTCVSITAHVIDIDWTSVRLSVRHTLVLCRNSRGKEAYGLIFSIHFLNVFPVGKRLNILTIIFLNTKKTAASHSQ